MAKIGLIGVGYWGSKIKQALEAVKDIDVVTATRDYKHILTDPRINRVIVATPVNTHYKIVSDCIRHGKDVMCEKAFTCNLRDAKALCDMSIDQGTLLACDYTYTFMTETLESDILSAFDIYNKEIKIYIEQQGRFRQEHVLSILGTHAFSLLDKIMGEDYSFSVDEVVQTTSKNACGFPTTSKVKMTFNTRQVKDIKVQVMVSLDSGFEEKIRHIFMYRVNQGMHFNFAEPNGINRMVDALLKGYDNKQSILKIGNMVDRAIELGDNR